jgi:hypothetical protein
MVSRTPNDLWNLTWARPEVDPVDLAAALQLLVASENLDFRTRLLVRDSVEALRSYWGEQRLGNWLDVCPVRSRIQAICSENLGSPGFPSLRERLMVKTDPEDLRRFLREVGSLLQRTIRVSIGGSAALILPGLLSRATEDIDVVDEVPSDIRGLHRQMADLKKRYGLQLTHFQSHYLPSGWEKRVHSQGLFGRLEVSLVDVYDIFLSKLFSARDKDRDDLRVLVPQLSKESIIQRLHDSAQALLGDEKFRPRAEHNWYILFGKPLPIQPPPQLDGAH